MIWELVDVDVVSASWQEVSDGDSGGCARNIWRRGKKVKLISIIMSNEQFCSKAILFCEYIDSPDI